jgi:hypothetical protein
MNLNANSKIVLLASAAFLIAAGLYGWSSASSPEAGIPFTAEGTVVATEFRPEHDATSKPLSWRRQYSHAEARAKIGAQYLIHIKLDSGESLTSSCMPQAIDMYPVGKRVRIQAERVAGLFFGKRTEIHSTTPMD